MQETRFGSWMGKIPWSRDRPPTPVFLGFPGDSDNKESASNAGDMGLIPGLGRTPGEGNGYPLHYSFWGIPWTEKNNSPYGHREPDTTEQLTHAPSVPSFWRVFNHKWVLNCVRSFLCIHWDDHIVFIFQRVHMAYHIDWFVCVEEFLHPWDKACLITMYDLFMCWILFSRILLKIFTSMFISDIGLQFSFFSFFLCFGFLGAERHVES